ncbi:filamentous hemagglutinin family outer membrane protein [Scytonema sp. HK-05]|uniref:beta strand repeat-containing protein n=1 Tax=Scytonema sp. HK-05 TaxID=1137095 RepID=UPI0009365AC3|nr:S-layer family protein [Scytonema sp. HK-05]OKH57263.1 hypothetical protein NIES2130_20700 [Scytonema sp. HK-05]BAY48629.1 filamentous hemagglutinin family outer membrane protein [Scytonema sp. HK-05]
MKQSIYLLCIVNLSTFCGLATTNSTQAQIVPDGTLPNNSSVTIQGNVSTITGGTLSGNNLFHSFEQFSVPTGFTAYFNNASDIQNIISRVTGSSISNIDGLIRTKGTANLFLLNPNGIIFGPNASLNIGGSIIASTASSLKFTDGTQFNAKESQTTPLLTVSVPIGLQFGSNVGNILVQGSGLAVQTGKTLALVGGNVSLEGGALGVSGGTNLAAPGGRIELGSVAENSQIKVTPTDQGWILGYEGVQNFKDIQLSQEAFVSTNGVGGGNIQLSGRRVTLSDGSQIVAVNRGAIAGGAFTVKASESVELRGTTANGEFSSALISRTRSAGSGADLKISTGKLIVRDGAQIVTGTSGEGLGGTLTVNASESVDLSGISAFDNEVPSGLYTTAEEQARGAGGNLTLTTGRLFVRGGAQIATATRGQGRAGQLMVNASESVELSGIAPGPGGSPSGLLTDVQGGARGMGGDLTLNTRQLIVQDGARVSSATWGRGSGGSLTVNASESVEVSGKDVGGSRSILTAQTRGPGNAGDLMIKTGQLIVADGAEVSASTTRAGDAGNVTITTGKLVVRDGAQVTVGSQGTGSAGNLKVTARSIKLDNQAKITAETGSGNGGDIILQNRDLLLLRRGSRISATAGTAQQGGDGGNITINTPNGFIVAVPNENSDITANAFSGNGGQVTINATGIFGMIPRSREDLVKLLQTNDPNQLDPVRLLTNDISAISQANPSLNGVVTINTPDVDPNRGLVELPVNLVDASQQIAQSCTPRDGQTSRFVATGRGGLPLSPSEPLRSRAVITQWVTLDEQTGNQKDAEAKPMALSEHPADNREPIVEANGWVVDKKGDVYLVAQVPNATSSFQTTTASCLTRN